MPDQEVAEALRVLKRHGLDYEAPAKFIKAMQVDEEFVFYPSNSNYLESAECLFCNTRVDYTSFMATLVSYANNPKEKKAPKAYDFIKCPDKCSLKIVMKKVDKILGGENA